MFALGLFRVYVSGMFQVRFRGMFRLCFVGTCLLAKRDVVGACFGHVPRYVSGYVYIGKVKHAALPEFLTRPCWKQPYDEPPLLALWLRITAFVI